MGRYFVASFAYMCSHYHGISVAQQGVSSGRQQHYGGSAAQSTLFPALDAALGVSHSSHSSNAFLLEMRNYMPQGRRLRPNNPSNHAMRNPALAALSGLEGLPWELNTKARFRKAVPTPPPSPARLMTCH